MPLANLVVTLTIGAFVGAMLPGLLLVWLLRHSSAPRPSVPAPAA